MRTLEIHSFSCIDSAKLELTDLTVIIGPQASGKSVICKIFYFFNRFPSLIPGWVSDASSPADIKERLTEEFVQWFPPSSWGPKGFTITFETGAFGITASRGRKARNGQYGCRIHFSEAFEALLASVFSTYAKAVQKKGAGQEQFEVHWRVFEALRKSIESGFGPDLPEESLYIPAGRSFFTSVGKIVTAFDDQTLLDPVVHNFGRLVTALREGSFHREVKTSLLDNIEELMGGKIVQERNKQYFATNDGRSIPLNALSSGQQELLPLLDALKFALWREGPALVFIEEPEAHLFPDAQTSLVEMFARICNSYRRKAAGKPVNPRKIVITTHSPYVLAKINTLIKAGQLTDDLPAQARRSLDSIVPQDARIARGRASAFAIQGRQLVPIMDEYGLINADYIDEVSERTGSEFSDLLDLEASYDR
ncbi:AAA family ATPase [Xanthomonas sp. NCPPB 2632]|uniref:AAA family ATPase n=1 Tax=Xanthomonas sp. NCPPB 2632 TaxID=3240912 RepID=UPI003516651B